MQDPSAWTAQTVSIAQAAIRVIVNSGFDAVSVRTVAAEAQVAAGSVQYHMGTRDELLAKALMYSTYRQHERVKTHRLAGSIRDRLAASLMELLPTGGVQREDAVMWVTFNAAASTRDWLAGVMSRELELFQERVAAALRAARDAGELVSGIDEHAGARLITALVRSDARLSQRPN
ncbi:TetR family transcriptional regulator C-terminal domain-containing protein [uncultured Gulosibacter sp.]|uniref:TetR/AcrR family transcriptional regulator n=1 Tax=uncultured Gulosibacter sp. TaxID=1339167 RepID=UPI0028893D4C|nr:TetR family transcriptional regulator C-terminal domain-containing protein [uncultured Gulosibacter sp.]